MLQYFDRDLGFLYLDYYFYLKNLPNIEKKFNRIFVFMRTVWSKTLKDLHFLEFYLESENLPKIFLEYGDNFVNYLQHLFSLN